MKKKMMTVTVIDRALQSRLWGYGYRSIHQVLCTVKIEQICPVCGGPRAEPHLERYCEDGEYYSVSRWKNPCGHIDKYADVLNESRPQRKETT